jgi:hypothetical protein
MHLSLILSAPKDYTIPDTRGLPNSCYPHKAALQESRRSLAQAGVVENAGLAESIGDKGYIVCERNQGCGAVSEV